MYESKMIPILKINGWLNKERELGSTNPDRVVLATTSKNAIPHSRIVAIREISEEGILFFTQQGTRKVSEINENPYASMTLWLPLQQRQVVLDGIVKELTSEENLRYWKTMPRDRQLRFTAYAPTSGKVIRSIDEIKKQNEILSKQFDGKEIPMSEYYCGFRLIPDILYFYTLGVETFSKVKMYKMNQGQWQEYLLSP